MEQAISKAPKRTLALKKARPYLIEVGDKLEDDIPGFLSATGHGRFKIVLAVCAGCFRLT